MTQPNRRSARELARLVRERELSPVEILDAHLAAIERANPAVNAIVTLAIDQAREAARAAEAAVKRGDALGLLHGVPVAIKDITPTEGIRTTWGSTLFADHGNTVNRVFGATRNPWDPRLSASGSTGGGGAALAAALVPLAEGTDFGGSLRKPASFCGVVGL